MEESIIFKPLYSLKHSPINAHFSKNSHDFVVRERPLYKFSGKGEHLILHISKKDLSTNEALRLLSEASGARVRDFGYGGLKDKQALSFQYLSMPKKFESFLARFSHSKLKIVEIFTHNNKLKRGHLRGNSFFIRLKKVLPSDALKLEQALITLDKEGFANYFGYQRFGNFGDNYKEGLEILRAKKMKNTQMRTFLICALQSHFFNRYLSKRVELSHFIRDFSQKELMQVYQFSKEELSSLSKQGQFFKLLRGEVLGHYPLGRCFLCENLDRELDRFKKRKISPMGALMGLRLYEPGQGLALSLENELFKDILEFKTKMQGSRRFMWSYLEDLKWNYNEQKAHFCMEFFLQRGCYASVIIEELLHRRF